MGLFFMPIKCIMIANMSKDRDSGKKSGSVPEDGKRLWVEVTKDVRKLDADKTVPQGSGEKPLKISIKTPVVTPKPIEGVKSGNKNLDRRTESKLRKGEMQIDGRLDLHGHTANAAKERLLVFIQQAIVSNKRCVLVITGKGDGGRGSGIIRREFRLWLEDARVRTYILSVTEAAVKHGGGGAWYVYLRKNRP